MPIFSTQPIQISGNTYPYLTVNLAISPLIRDYIGGSVAMKLTPYRELPDNQFEILEDMAKNVVYMDVFQTIDSGDTDLGNVVNTIMGGIQQYIIDKGL
jgi:hypothetical protein